MDERTQPTDRPRALRDPIVLALVAGLRSIERQRAEQPANVVALRPKRRTAA